MTLREQLKERANTILAGYLEMIDASLKKCAMCDDDLILKMAIGGRVKSVHAKAIRQVVDNLEYDLMKKYNDQTDAFEGENL